MVVSTLTDYSKNMIDKHKVEFVEFGSAIEMSNYIECMPLHVVKVKYQGNNDEVRHALELQFPIKENDYMRRGRYQLEVDITTKCNLACNNCIRFSQFKSVWYTTDLDDIIKLIDDNKHLGKELNFKILGGEPILHPNIDEIISYAYDSGLCVTLFTNGIMPYTPPRDIAINNSSKDKGVQPVFHTTMAAPKDYDEFDGVDYSMGCPAADHCGVGYSEGKYYPCSSVTQMCRILTEEGKLPELGVDTLDKALDVDYRAYFFNSVCKWCGMFKRIGFHDRDRDKFSRQSEEVITESWEFMRGRK